MANHYQELKDLGVEVAQYQPRQHFVHKAWHDSSEAIAKSHFPNVG